MNVSKTIIRFKNVATQKFLKRWLFFGDSQTFFLSCFPDGKKSTFFLLEKLFNWTTGGSGSRWCWWWWWWQWLPPWNIEHSIHFGILCRVVQKIKKKFWMNRLFGFFSTSQCLFVCRQIPWRRRFFSKSTQFVAFDLIMRGQVRMVLWPLVSSEEEQVTWSVKGWAGGNSSSSVG